LHFHAWIVYQKECCRCTCYDCMWGNGGVTALILNLSTGWMQVFILIFLIFSSKTSSKECIFFYLIHFMTCSNDGYILVDFVPYVCTKIFFKILLLNMIYLPQTWTLMFIARNHLSWVRVERSCSLHICKWYTRITNTHCRPRTLKVLQLWYNDTGILCSIF
jgi:hypothetical protein